MTGVRFINARIVRPDGVSDGQLCVSDGVIVDDVTDAEVVDCGGKLLAPGIVDLGVFAIDREAFRAGGIVRVGLMPEKVGPQAMSGLPGWRAPIGDAGA